ncbi:MAG: metallophosphatase [Bacteroidales bacterium]|nr:metallophosphatase [Bacteroidales bacterium]
MKKQILCVIWLLFSLCVFSCNHQIKPEDKFPGADGPYIFYLPDQKARILSIDEDGWLQDSITEIPENFSFHVTSHDGLHQFPVKLHSIKRKGWKHDAPEKTLVLGDPHGNIDCFVNVLQANGVINDRYEWTYDTNHLMVEGDIFDRGDDVLAIFWLVYKLEQEAEEAGGKVSFIYGNHETMVMANDLRYMNEKYTKLAKRYEAEMTYADFFGLDTELGRWLAEKNTIEVIGRDLFVHAGLSEQVCRTNLTIPQINEELSRGLHKSKEERNRQSEYSKLLFTTNGLVWYRGLVDPTKDHAITDEKDLDAILQHFDAERIIVGHTIFGDITTFFNGKVVAVNVNNLKNREANKGRGILIQDGKIYIIYGDGRKNELK